MVWLLLRTLDCQRRPLRTHVFSFEMAFRFSKTLQNPCQAAILKNPVKGIQTPPLLFSRFSSTVSTNLPPPPASDQAQDFVPREKKPGGRWSRWLLFLPGAITFGLGTWQIFRREEKIQMIDYRRKRLELEPILWNSLSSSYGDFGSLEFRRVECEGAFDESKSVYIGPRSRSISGVTENGYYIVTPLMLSSRKPDSVQSTLLVNRGWVPRSWRDKHLEESQDLEKPSDKTQEDVGKKGEYFWWRFWAKKREVIKDEECTVPHVKIIGVVRGSEKPSIFVPANDPSSGQWFYVDIPSIARSLGLPENTVYIEDINENINPSQPYPVPKDVNSLIHYSVMPQDHLNYTLTWYSLSAAVTFMAYKRLKPKKRLR